MARVSRNASIPYRPYSRPTPENLNPPQCACGGIPMCGHRFRSLDGQIVQKRLFKNCLRLEERLDPVDAEFATEARVFEPERRLLIV